MGGHSKMDGFFGKSENPIEMDDLHFRKPPHVDFIQQFPPSTAGQERRAPRALQSLAPLPCPGTYPLVNVNKKLWKITIFHGKIHYFNGHFPVRFLYVYQRVSGSE